MNVKIFQWNFFYKENPDNIIQLIKKNNPDIITAQELIQNTETDIDRTKYIVKKLNYFIFIKRPKPGFQLKTIKPVKEMQFFQNIRLPFPVLFIYPHCTIIHQTPIMKAEYMLKVKLKLKINY
jgi:hypothetical protein